jgi:hypothetical protein
MSKIAKLTSKRGIKQVFEEIEDAQLPEKYVIFCRQGLGLGSTAG